MAAKKKTAKKKAARKGAKKRAATRKKKATKNARAPKAGTTLTRAFKGEEHKVTVAKDGTYRYEGESYRSLTQVAKQITGYTSVSGPRFFGTAEASKGGSR